jgi:diaminopimelate decarboxylase
MHLFRYAGGQLHCEGLPLADLAVRYGTPLYVYSAATLDRHFGVFDRAFEGRRHLVCYSVKACSNLSVLRRLGRLGSGFDVVSGGELYRVLHAAGDPRTVVFSGVGKSDEELAYALKSGILLFNVESEGELEAISRVAKRLRRRARIAVRVNPDVDPKTHPYVATGLRTSKFGIPMERAAAVYARARELPGVEAVGVDCHIGSQLVEVAPFVDALGRVKRLVEGLRADGFPIEYLDLGGGLGIPYDDEAPPPPRSYGAAVRRALGRLDVTLLLEPGRVIVGNAGVLVTRVLYRKPGVGKEFVIVDAGMNDLVRPALYGAHHAILPVERSRGRRTIRADVVGPVCESGDFLAKDRDVADVGPGDLLAVMSAGAYGFAMASNYNSRPRPAEVLVDGGRALLARRRETYADLVHGERAG